MLKMARAILSVARDAAPGCPDILTKLARALQLDGDHAAAADALSSTGQRNLRVSGSLLADIGRSGRRFH